MKILKIDKRTADGKLDGKPTYIDAATKAPIKDETILKYLQSLVIPPNYHDVEIYYHKPPKKDKLSYIGYDAKDRPQHIYHKWWVEKARKNKYCGLIKFGEMIPKILATIKSYVGLKKMSKNKLIGTIVSLILHCGFRVGNDKYSKMYKSYGLTTIEKRHITFTQAKNKELKDTGVTIAHISFIGKKGVLNECTVTGVNDASNSGPSGGAQDGEDIVQILLELTKGKKPEDRVFVTNEPGHEPEEITPLDINNFLKGFDESITSKMFRTFQANLMLIEKLRLVNPQAMVKAGDRKKHVKQVITEISQTIHNTPAICKKEYIFSEIWELYLEKPRSFNGAFGSNGSAAAKISPRIAFMNFMRRRCGGDKAAHDDGDGDNDGNDDNSNKDG